MCLAPMAPKPVGSSTAITTCRLACMPARVEAMWEDELLVEWRNSGATCMLMQPMLGLLRSSSWWLRVVSCGSIHPCTSIQAYLPLL